MRKPTASGWDRMAAAADVAVLLWAGAWGCAMALHGQRYGDVSGIIGAVGFLVSLAVVLASAAACHASLRGKPWRWWAQGLALLLFAFWYSAWFAKVDWRIWPWQT